MDGPKYRLIPEQQIARSRGVLIVLLAWCSCSIALRAADCSASERSVTDLQSRIVADQGSIRRLNPSLTSNELNDWTNATDKERQAILKRTLNLAISTLADTFISAPELAQTKVPGSLLGVELPNGIRSLNAVNIKAIIPRLESLGITDPFFLDAVQAVGRMSGKPDSFETMEVFSRLASGFKDLAEMGSSNDTLEEAEAALQFVGDLAGFGGLVTASIASFEYSKDTLDAYLIASAVGHLGKTSESELPAIRSVSGQLQRDVQALQAAKVQLQACKNGDAPQHDSSGYYCLNPRAVIANQVNLQDIQSMLSTGNMSYGYAAMASIRNPDGSYIPWYVPCDQVSPRATQNSTSKSPPPVQRAPDPAEFQVLSDDAQVNQSSLANELTSVQSQASNLQSQLAQYQAQIDSIQQAILSPSGSASSVSLPPRRIYVPAGWVPCTCPDKHPHAGLLVNGTRYHSPELQCDRYF